LSTNGPSAVLSHHTNPATCGVGKFNVKLARELGIPCESLKKIGTFTHPLVSVKPEELHRYALWTALPQPYDLFLHGWTGSVRDQQLAMRADRVYAANSVIAADVRPHRPEVITAWCPVTIVGNPHRGTINVLTFGMAHKIHTARYEQLNTLLEATGEDYTVSLSTAVHEGSPWDATATAADELRGIFGGRLRYLGYLADDALVKELQECSAVALFFDPALRTNNTTMWAALQASKPTITNIDEHSPDVNGLFDIERMDHWPYVGEVADYVSDGPRCAETFGWSRLVDLMQGVSCAK